MVEVGRQCALLPGFHLLDGSMPFFQFVICLVELRLGCLDVGLSRMQSLRVFAVIMIGAVERNQPEDASGQDLFSLVHGLAASASSSSGWGTRTSKPNDQS